MKKLVVMAGIPGSGKSTYAKKEIDKLNGKAIIISRDEIRFSILKDGEDYFAHENEVFKEFINQIKWNLENTDLIVYADATHVNIGSRTKLLRALGETLKNVKVECIFMKTSLEECFRRNDLRSGIKKVPQGALRRMFYSSEEPTFEEGFDNIFFIKNNEIEVISK